MDSFTEDYVLDKECYVSTECSTVLIEYLAQCEKEYQGEELNEQLSLGFSFLDGRLDVLKNGEVVFLTSKSNSPRIDFAETCIYNIANQFLEKAERENDKKCLLYFNFEDSINDICNRLFSKRKNLSWRKINLDVFNKLATFVRENSGLPIYFNDCRGKIPTTDFIYKTMHTLNNKEKIGFVVIENLDSLTFKNEDYYSIMKKIKRIAKCFDVPILVLNQLKEDIKDTYLECMECLWELERKFCADKVIFIHSLAIPYNAQPIQFQNELDTDFQKRQDIWEKKYRENENLYKIIVAQQRYNIRGMGPTIKVVSYDYGTGNFSLPSENTKENSDDDIPF